MMMAGTNSLIGMLTVMTTAALVPSNPGTFARQRCAPPIACGVRPAPPAPPAVARGHGGGGEGSVGLLTLSSSERMALATLWKWQYDTGSHHEALADDAQLVARWTGDLPRSDWPKVLIGRSLGAFVCSSSFEPAPVRTFIALGTVT